MLRNLRACARHSGAEAAVGARHGRQQHGRRQPASGTSDAIEGASSLCRVSSCLSLCRVCLPLSCVSVSPCVVCVSVSLCRVCLPVSPCVLIYHRQGDGEQCCLGEGEHAAMLSCEKERGGARRQRQTRQTSLTQALHLATSCCACCRSPRA